MPEKFFKGGVFYLKRPPLLFLILFWLLSCGVTPYLKDTRSVRLIENVPFFPQEAFQCGPASLANVLNYWGVDVSPEEIATVIYSPSARGTLNLDMVLYAEKKGMKAIHYKGSVGDIKNKIDLGYPVIVLVDLGFWVYQQNHFMVVVGYHEDGIIAHSGKDRLKPIALKNFIKTWERTNFWTLLITP